MPRPRPRPVCLWVAACREPLVGGIDDTPGAVVERPSSATPMPKPTPRQGRERRAHPVGGSSAQAYLHMVSRAIPGSLAMAVPHGALHVMTLGRSKMGINKASNADERTAYRQDRFVGASAYVQLSPQPGANLVGKHDVTGTYHPPVLSIVRCHPNVLNRSSFLTCNLGPRGRDRRAS